ncbi:DivIVA domain-containing protein [Gordonia aurantiaca]|uniref:DivIVA domain-containing protein n=1 Tax=Gordonia sp. B21 TaxID=3151852 RepID=UPI003262F4CF
MQTLLLYLLILALVAGVIYALVWFVFGRGEELPPVEPDTTLTRLPSSGISGDDVRALRFQQTLRGYKQAEVDWALARLAREVDDLRAVIVRLREREQVSQTGGGAGIAGASPDIASDGVADAETVHEQGVSGAGGADSAVWEPGPCSPGER